MKSYFQMCATTVVLAFFSVNTSANNQNVCEVKYLAHQNLATILENPVGLSIIDNSRQHLMDICMDPLAHNAIVSLMDGVADVITHPTVSQTLGNMFYWTRKVIKSEKFRDVWYELLVGLNMLADQHIAVTTVTNTIYNGLDMLLTNSKFDSSFEKSFIKLLSLVKSPTKVEKKSRPQTPRRNTKKRVTPK